MFGILDQRADFLVDQPRRLLTVLRTIAAVTTNQAQTFSPPHGQRTDGSTSSAACPPSVQAIWSRNSGLDQR